MVNKRYGKFLSVRTPIAFDRVCVWLIWWSIHGFLWLYFSNAAWLLVKYLAAAVASIACSISEVVGTTTITGRRSAVPVGVTTVFYRILWNRKITSTSSLPHQVLWLWLCIPMIWLIRCHWVLERITSPCTCVHALVHRLYLLINAFADHSTFDEFWQF